MSFRGTSGTPASGFATALATKVLHAKRRASVPVIEGATIQTRFMDPTWHPTRIDRPKARHAVTDDAVAAVVKAIYRCVSDPRNQAAWLLLESEFSDFTRIELFDMAWWAVVRGGPNIHATLI